MVVRLGFMVRMLMVVRLVGPWQMSMFLFRFLFFRMRVVRVGVGVPMFMFMFMRMAVHLFAMPVLVIMQMSMPVRMFMGMLQLHDLQTTSISIGEVELIQAGQVGVTEKIAGAVILHQSAIMQHKGPIR